MRSEKTKQYQKEWYQKNRQRVLENQKEYRNLNKDKNRLFPSHHGKKKSNYNKLYYIKKKEEIRNQQQRYYIKHIHEIQQRRVKNNEQIIEIRKLYNLKNRDKRRDYARMNYRKNIEVRKAYYKEFEKRAERIAYRKLWLKNNPKRSHGYDSLELEYAMNDVRLRDNNTCQWFGCGLTYKEAPIHVHHIFPRSEYPELELEKRYMICYCANHHALFHRYREDRYFNLIYKKVDIENELLIEGND